MAIVVLILGILASVAIPHFDSVATNMAAYSFFAKLKRDLDWARSYANTQSSSITVQIDPDTDQYIFVGIDDPDHPGQDYSCNVSKEFGADIISADFNSGETSFTFDGYGRVQHEGTIGVSIGPYTVKFAISHAGEVSVE